MSVDISSDRSFRFAAVISHPIQHYSPLFRDLAKVPGMEVKVFYACDHGVRESFDPGFGQSFRWDVPLLEGYDYEFLRTGHTPEKFGYFDVDSPDLAEKLDAYHPHALWVHGYGQRLSWRALRWARGKSAVIYFGDSELLRRRSPAARLAKEFVLRWFFRRCDAFLTVGDRNEEYYRHYGVPPSKLFRGACPVDVARFRAALSEPGRLSRDDMRRKWGIPKGALTVLHVGKIEDQKRPLDLLEAVALLREKGEAVHALFVGDGPLRRRLEARAGDLGLSGQVKVTGFINQREMPLLYEAGDVLAVTSERDAHPLAVSEGLIAGLPVVASDRVGCVGPTDTARPGINALVYPCGDREALAGALLRLAHDERVRGKMGAASRSLADSQDVGTSVRTLLDIIGALRNSFRSSWSDVPEPVLDDFALFPGRRIADTPEFSGVRSGV